MAVWNPIVLSGQTKELFESTDAFQFCSRLCENENSILLGKPYSSRSRFALFQVSYWIPFVPFCFLWFSAEPCAEAFWFTLALGATPSQSIKQKRIKTFFKVGEKVSSPYLTPGAQFKSSIFSCKSKLFHFQCFLLQEMMLRAGLTWLWWLHLILEKFQEMWVDNTHSCPVLVDFSNVTFRSVPRAISMQEIGCNIELVLGASLITK